MPKVSFQIEAPGASEVFVAGDFNNWSTTSVRLFKKQDKGDGLFGTQIPLKPGKYEFKFVIDGEWVCDPVAPRVLNPFGTENSVLSVESKPATRTNIAAIGAK